MARRFAGRIAVSLTAVPQAMVLDDVKDRGPPSPRPRPISHRASSVCVNPCMSPSCGPRGRACRGRWGLTVGGPRWQTPTAPSRTTISRVSAARRPLARLVLKSCPRTLLVWPVHAAEELHASRRVCGHGVALLCWGLTEYGRMHRSRGRTRVSSKSMRSHSTCRGSPRS